MEEDIKILEDFINGTLFKYARNAFDEEDLRNTLDKAIETLIKGYKAKCELIEKLKQDKDILYGVIDEIKEDYIPKSKIKEKIEELEKEKDYYYSDYKIDELNDKIQVLQELMEDK